MTDIKSYDVIILGGGNAGFGASAILADAGQSIAFVEERDFGGTCPNRGCTPKKVLVAAAHALDEISRAEAHHISVSTPHLDWEKLIARKDEMIGFIPGAMGDLAAKRGDVYRGTARFTGPNTIAVGDHLLEARNIVIATGSKPRPLPIEGAELMTTSDDILSETQRPDEVVFVGGGVIALEFSHVYARAGTKVTILEVMPQLLPRMDSDAVAQLREATEALGVRVETGVSVNRVRTADGKLAVEFSRDDKTETLVADRVINGAGRVANVDGLDLDAAEIAHDGIRIEIGPNLQSTSNAAVWVAGDALVHSAQLSPVATYEGQVVGRNILNGGTETPDYSVIPSSVYTVPSFASVGLTEAAARDAGTTVRVAVNDMSGWFSGKSYAERTAWSKVVVDADNDLVLGAHIIGHNADDLIHIFALAMKHGITAESLKNTIYAFPSFTSDIKNIV